MSYENVKNKGFDNRTTEEVREIASRGGRASGEARRKKADFRKTLNQLLTAQIDSPEWTPILQTLGLDSTLESALNMAMIKEGLAGNVKAYEAIAKYSGQSTDSDVDIRNKEADIELKQARTKVTEQSITSGDNAKDQIKDWKEAIMEIAKKRSAIDAGTDADT